MTRVVGFVLALVVVLAVGWGAGRAVGPVGPAGPSDHGAPSGDHGNDHGNYHGDGRDD